MRRTWTRALTATLALIGAIGCAGVGETNETLRAVDEDALTTRLLYLRPELSPFPVTAGELEASGEDPATAIPVRVEVYDDLAVAWYAPGGEPLIGRDSIVALWDVVDRQPISGEVDQREPVTVIEPDRPVYIDEVPRSLEDAPAEAQQQRTSVPLDEVRATIIDFYDRVGTPDQIWMIEELAEAHPGCI
jgi:hypothetical protein